jgi:uncharacterized protein
MMAAIGRALGPRWWWAVLAALLAWAAPAAARQVPALRGRVTDEAGVLSTAATRQLEERLAAYEQATGRQLAVLVVQSLEGDPLEDFSIRVAEAWTLGRAGQDDGILLLLAIEERKVRIEVGYGLEGEVTDLVSARIIHGVMRPYLRRGSYDEAVAEGVEALIAVAGPGVGPPPGGSSAWEHQVLGRAPLWFVMMGLVTFGILAVCFWQPLIGVVAVLLMGPVWWPAALLGAVAIGLRWWWDRRPRLRDGHGVVRRARPGERPDLVDSLWRGYGALAVLSMLGDLLSSRAGRDVAAGLGKVIGRRGFSGLGGRFGGGGASGGW